MEEARVWMQDNVQGQHWAAAYRGLDCLWLHDEYARQEAE